MTTPMEVRTLPIDRLVPAGYNPRLPLKPTDKAYRKLKRSLEEFGLVEPLVWNELTGRVVGGHLRLSILTELGRTEVPVSVVRLSEAAEKALNVVLNNQEAQGRYDVGKLSEVLEDLHGLSEFAATGFDPSMLSVLRFEPADVPLADLRDPTRVEVTLVMDAATFERARSRVDELVGEFDLESHVRRG
jgi:ParB-like chromosome segregation protein Spo0J